MGVRMMRTHLGRRDSSELDSKDVLNLFAALMMRLLLLFICWLLTWPMQQPPQDGSMPQAPFLVFSPLAPCLPPEGFYHWLTFMYKSFPDHTRTTHRPQGELIISNKILSLDFEARFKSSQQISLKDHSYFFHNLASEAHLEISEKTRSLLI